MRIFISHPYASNPELNKIKVDKICRELVAEGYTPISPLHLFSFYDDDSNREEVLEVCYHLIECVDELWCYGDSEGCRLEMNYAHCIDIPVRLVNI